MTPLQTEAHQRHKRFHQAIAERALQLTNRKAPAVLDAAPVRKHQPACAPSPIGTWWHCMWFADLVPVREPGPVSVEMIQRAVARHFGLTKARLIEEGRTLRVVLPRQIAMYLCKQLTSRSLPEIGRRFGGKDHTTVLHAVSKISARCVSDALFAGQIEGLKAELQG